MELEPEPEPEPQLFKSWNRNRNHNFSKVGTGTGTGTVKNSYGSTTLLQNIRIRNTGRKKAKWNGRHTGRIPRKACGKKACGQ